MLICISSAAKGTRSLDPHQLPTQRFVIELCLKCTEILQSVNKSNQTNKQTRPIVFAGAPSQAECTAAATGY